MVKSILFKFQSGSFETGFHVEISFYQETVICVKLPANPELLRIYQTWETLSLEKGLSLEKADRQELVAGYQSLTYCFQQWLRGDGDVQKLRETILLELTDRQEEIRVLIQTSDRILRQLPWKQWDIFCNFYPQAEVALTLTEYHPLPDFDETPVRDRVRILAVVGDRPDSETLSPLKRLKSLPDGELVVVKSTDPQLLYLQLQDETGWDILFIGNREWIQTLNIPEFKQGLEIAINLGLKLAIFNNGLDMAELLANLSNPPILVLFRQPVLDAVAVKFFSSFLISFAKGKFLYPAVGEGRYSLESFEPEFPGVMWVPILCHHPEKNSLTWRGILGQPALNTPRNRHEYLERKKLLHQVRKTWIHGVLENTLADQTLLNLGLENCPAALRQGKFFDATPEEHRERIPANTRLIQYLDGLKMGRTLLILGEAGSGKTVLLLELARDAIARGLRDYSQPIPVVLNLSSWGVKHLPIAQWVIAEASAHYRISPTWLNSCLEEQRLLLLLDGLDELNPDSQSLCVTAINAFIAEYPLTEIVLTSRQDNYQSLVLPLNFKAALSVQPLSLAQVDAYVAQFSWGKDINMAALKADPDLKELATNPLMLNIICLVYQGNGYQNSSQLLSKEEHRQCLFDAYISQMLYRRTRGKWVYSPEELLGGLSWLAGVMHQHSQSIFFLDRLQPKWLETRLQTQLALGVGLLFGLIGGTIVGVVIWLTLGFFLDPFWGIVISLILGVMFGLPFGIWAILTVGKEKKIQPVETLNWSWNAVKKALTLGLGLGLIIGIMSGMIGFVIVAPLMVLTMELKGENLQQKQFSNQGIWQSLKNAAILAAIAAAVLGLTAGLMREKILFAIIGAEAASTILGTPWMQQFTLRIILSGIILGLFYGLNQAGIACIQHFTMRWLLWRTKQIPWNYSRFLNYANQRNFLRKVGGGYMFIHRLLLEHFTTL